MRDGKLDAPLSSHTRSCSHSADFALDYYALAISSLCDEDESATFDEVQNSDNWWATMQS